MQLRGKGSEGTVPHFLMSAVSTLG